MAKRVFVVSGSDHRRYHTLEDCLHLTLVTSYREVDLGILGDHVSECRTCQNGGHPPQTHTGKGHFNSLLRAAKDEAEGEEVRE